MGIGGVEHCSNIYREGAGALTSLFYSLTLHLTGQSFLSPMSVVYPCKEDRAPMID